VWVAVALAAHPVIMDLLRATPTSRRLRARWWTRPARCRACCWAGSPRPPSSISPLNAAFLSGAAARADRRVEPWWPRTSWAPLSGRALGRWSPGLALLVVLASLNGKRVRDATRAVRDWRATVSLRAALAPSQMPAGRRGGDARHRRLRHRARRDGDVRAVAGLGHRPGAADRLVGRGRVVSGCARGTGRPPFSVRAFPGCPMLFIAVLHGACFVGTARAQP